MKKVKCTQCGTKKAKLKKVGKGRLCADCLGSYNNGAFGDLFGKQGDKNG